MNEISARVRRCIAVAVLVSWSPVTLADVSFTAVFVDGQFDPVVRLVLTANQTSPNIEDYWAGGAVIKRGATEVAADFFLGEDYPPYGVMHTAVIDGPCTAGRSYTAEYQLVSYLLNGADGNVTEGISTIPYATCPIACANGF